MRQRAATANDKIAAQLTERWEDRPKPVRVYRLTKPDGTDVEFTSLYRLASLLRTYHALSPTVAKVAATRMQQALTNGDRAAWHGDIRVRQQS